MLIANSKSTVYIVNVVLFTVAHMRSGDNRDSILKGVQRYGRYSDNDCCKPSLSSRMIFPSTRSGSEQNLPIDVFALSVLILI